MTTRRGLAILGTGNIGRAMAIGVTERGGFAPGEVILTRRRLEALDDLAGRGFGVQSDNVDAVKRSDTVIVAVEPGQLDTLLQEIGPALSPGRHLLISVVSGATIDDILRQVGEKIPVVRAMPNTAISLGQSMTCLATHSDDSEAIDAAVGIFGSVGRTLVISEELIVPATALCACGVAFFLRAVRAASQGGIEIGFHPAEALSMAAQTALGAASLVLESGKHPEDAIDNVTTPRGCTIAGLNEMEHQGFGSAMIKGIILSANKAAALYRDDSS